MRRVLLAVALLLAVGVHAHPGSAIAVRPNGEVVFVDTGAGIFVVDARGTLKRAPGPAYHWFALDVANRFANVRFPYIAGGELQASGGVVLASDFPVAIATDGALCFAQADGDRLRIVCVGADGRVSTRATLPPGPRWLNGLAAGPAGSLYYSEDAAVRVVDARGKVGTVAERISVPDCASIPSDESVRKPYLRGLAVAPDGSVYVAASGCGALLRIHEGRAVVVLRTSPPWSPTAAAVAGGEVYVLEYLHTATDDRRQWLPRVRKIARDGRVTTLVESRRR